RSRRRSGRCATSTPAWPSSSRWRTRAAGETTSPPSSSASRTRRDRRALRPARSLLGPGLSIELRRSQDAAHHVVVVRVVPFGPQDEGLAQDRMLGGVEELGGAEDGELVKGRGGVERALFVELRAVEREAIAERLDGPLVALGVERAQRQELPAGVDEHGE